MGSSWLISNSFWMSSVWLITSYVTHIWQRSDTDCLHSSSVVQHVSFNTYWLVSTHCLTAIPITVLKRTGFPFHQINARWTVVDYPLFIDDEWWTVGDYPLLIDDDEMNGWRLPVVYRRWRDERLAISRCLSTMMRWTVDDYPLFINDDEMNGWRLPVVYRRWMLYRLVMLNFSISSIRLIEQKWNIKQNNCWKWR